MFLDKYNNRRTQKKRNMVSCQEEFFLTAIFRSCHREKTLSYCSAGFSSTEISGSVCESQPLIVLPTSFSPSFVSFSVYL